VKVVTALNPETNTKLVLYTKGAVQQVVNVGFHSGFRRGGGDRSVGIATGYGLDGPGIESWWGRDFSHTSRQPLGPTHILTIGTGSFPGVKRPGRGIYHPPLLLPRSIKSSSIPLPPSGPSGLLRGTFT
jgi:hypothetical protein